MILLLLFHRDRLPIKKIFSSPKIYDVKGFFFFQTMEFMSMFFFFFYGVPGFFYHFNYDL